MKDNTKSSKVGVIISVFAMIIASITFGYAIIKGRPNWANSIILLCTITIFFSNVSIYKSQKNKDNNNKKNI
jgi:type IV secretory pathway VirB2 component (pilin)